MGKPCGYWSRERIRQFVTDNNISSRKELERLARGAYNAAHRFGMLYDLFGEKLHKSWTMEKCAELARKCRFRSEFAAKYYNAY